MIGQPAPDFTLPAVHRDGEISLAEYRGRSPVLLAIFMGLYCPFCRRNIAQLGGTREKLRPAGVDVLGVVATEIDNARLYFKYRPARVPLVADPALVTHRAFGLPRVAVTDEMMAEAAKLRVNPTGELPEPVPVPEIGGLLDRADGYIRNDADRRDIDRQWPQSEGRLLTQLKGQFLIDRDGMIRWANVERPEEYPARVGAFPSDEELLAAAGSLA
jgi:peroxiredoxin